MSSRRVSRRSARAKPRDPSYARAAAVFAGAAHAWRPSERISVAEAAEKYLVLANPGGGPSGALSFAEAPYLRRPMECLTPGSGYTLVSLMGPGQCGKSTIGNAWCFAYTPIVDPADMLMLMPDHRIAHGYSTQQIGRLISGSPHIAERLVEDSIFQKRFAGCVFSLVWPAAAQLRARPFPRIRIDDYDAIPEDIDGEGDALVLTSARQTRFEGFECTLVNSSPALGAERGIEALVARGTDERWEVPCKHCGAFFALDYAKVFAFKRDGTPGEAAETARVLCPHCRRAHTDRDKPDLMARGNWRGTAAAGAHASFRIDGLMGFASWAKLAGEHREADKIFEETQDEEKLRAFWNARVGKNYAARAEREIEPEVLAERAGDYSMGTVPKGALFLIAAVDVQGNRFEIEVKGFDHQAQSWLVDRYAIRQVGRVDVRPATHPEHWRALLEEVIRRVYPLADNPALSLPIATTVIDMHGLPGATENCRAFWRHCRRGGIGDLQITLVRGANMKSAQAFPPPSWETNDRGKRIDGGAKFFTIGVHALKDTLVNRLARAEPGPGYLHFPADTPERYFRELAAERRVAGEWQRRGNEPNESLDLEVYAIAGYLRIRPERIDWKRPPWWAVAKESKGHAAPSPEVAGPGEGRADAPAALPAPAAAEAARSAPFLKRPRPPRRRTGFVQNW